MVLYYMLLQPTGLQQHSAMIQDILCHHPYPKHVRQAVHGAELVPSVILMVIVSELLK